MITAAVLRSKSKVSRCGYSLNKGSDVNGHKHLFIFFTKGNLYDNHV